MTCLPLSVLLSYTMLRSKIIQGVEPVVCFSLGPRVDSFPNRRHPAGPRQPNHHRIFCLTSPHCRSSDAHTRRAPCTGPRWHHQLYGPMRTRQQPVTSTIEDASPFLRCTRLTCNRRGRRHYDRRDATPKTRPDNDDIRVPPSTSAFSFPLLRDSVRDRQTGAISARAAGTVTIS